MHGLVEPADCISDDPSIAEAVLALAAQVPNRATLKSLIALQIPRASNFFVFQSNELLKTGIDTLDQTLAEHHARPK